MKLQNSDKQDRALDTLLSDWKVGAQLPPRFQEQVWHRIARAEVQAPFSLWSVLAHLIEGLLSRPKVAYSLAAIFLALGAASGTWAAQKQTGRLDAALGSRYVQSLDPYHGGSPGQ
jgi:hypothetical protein